LVREDAESTAPGKHARDSNQRDCAEKRDDDTLQVEPGHHQVTPEDEATHVTADDGANDTKDDVAHEPVAAMHKVTG
jgi:hypothetical protein